MSNEKISNFEDVLASRGLESKKKYISGETIEFEINTFPEENQDGSIDKTKKKTEEKKSSSNITEKNKQDDKNSITKKNAIFPNKERISTTGLLGNIGSRVADANDTTKAKSDEKKIITKENNQKSIESDNKRNKNTQKQRSSNQETKKQDLSKIESENIEAIIEEIAIKSKTEKDSTETEVNKYKDKPQQITDNTLIDKFNMSTFSIPSIENSKSSVVEKDVCRKKIDYNSDTDEYLKLGKMYSLISVASNNLSSSQDHGKLNARIDKDLNDELNDFLSKNKGITKHEVANAAIEFFLNEFCRK